MLQIEELKVEVCGKTILDNVIGKVAGIKAHLECKGLILNVGLMQAILKKKLDKAVSETQKDMI